MRLNAHSREKSNTREYPNKNPDIEIHGHREDGNDVTLVAICMALHQKGTLDNKQILIKDQSIGQRKSKDGY